jgi:hypothetical protein
VTRQRFVTGCCQLAVAIVLTGGLFACTQQAGTPTRYYAIDSLVRGQIHLLAARHATLTKTATLGAQQDTATFIPGDTLAWTKELDLFLELKILNKPTSVGAYTVTDNLPDTRSNLRIKSIETQQPLPVRYLKIFYHGTPARVRRIEAQFREDNSLYHSGRFLTMEFDELQQQPVLLAYSVTGGQKIFLGDTVAYTVSAKVSVPN